MSEPWYCLFVPLSGTGVQASNVAAALRELLAGQGYSAYDPFPGGTGTPPHLHDMVRQFVAPARAGWLCVLGQPDEAILPQLSRRLDAPVLYGWLADDERGGFALFRAGERLDDPAAFEPYLKPAMPPDRLTRAFDGTLPVAVEDSGEPPVAVLGADALPPDLQQMAQDRGVDPAKANTMFERLSGSLFGKLARQAGAGADAEQDQARAILMGGGRDLWNSTAGQRVRAIASVLDLPDHWRDPSHQALRDAYHVHRLRQRAPRMPLMPGDKEALDAVPDALEFLPVYMGR